MEQILEYLPLLIPLFIIECALVVAALVHLLRHPNYRFGNRVLWIVVVVFIQIIGPIVYFTVGRGED